MRKINCEDMLMTLMAQLDGEKTEISAGQAETHLSSCDDCRLEFEQMQNTFALLEKQTRRGQKADLWLEIEKRLELQNAAAPKLKWQPFILLAAFLVAYKLLELLPESELGLLFKLVPFLLIAALFGLIKENPFKINTELTLER
jgi:predicted anti-sigma-YlaC factor YlaD